MPNKFTCLIDETAADPAEELDRFGEQAKRSNCPNCGNPRATKVDMRRVELRVEGADPGMIERLRELLKEHGTLMVCAGCRTIWEPLPPGDHTDSDGSPFPFPEPCDNCAFRPGSPEVEDKAKWKELISNLKKGGRFYCHKGVPLGGPDGFQYPKKPDGAHDEYNMRLCRGFLNAWVKWEGFD